ncbi:hypothetical protein MMC14_009841, partial [Varicellaria rhodocarpa]|nr:hypothetical protein [Varicellaria rhodocarpa]
GVLNNSGVLNNTITYVRTLAIAVRSGDLENAVSVWNNDGKPISTGVMFDVNAGTAQAEASDWDHKNILADKFIDNVKCWKDYWAGDTS